MPLPPSTMAGWPDATNTGVPAGTTLTKYTGPCTITSTVTITGVDATSCGAIYINANNVVITSSLLPRIDANAGGTYSVSVTDSTVNGGTWSDGTFMGYNITVLRSNIYGGKDGVHCAGSCSVTDSWLHGQYVNGGTHNQAFLTNGGSNMVLRHNTLHCTAVNNSSGGGCTADVSLFGDFAPVSNVTVENNLLKANSDGNGYCAYGGYQPTKAYPIATNIKYINNVFEHGTNGQCGVWGPITSFQTTATGNTWSGNAYTDGVAIQP